jgi:hypothetical protein
MKISTGFLVILTAALLLPRLVAAAGEDTSAVKPALPSAPARILQQARESSRFFADAERLKPELRATADGKSFVLIWKAVPEPKHWIVSLHGAGKPARGFAHDDLAVWHPHLKDRAVGIMCVQWWLGTGDLAQDFLTPEEIYRDADAVLEALKVKPGAVMLHGFSRGSANTFAVAAIDAGRGKHYFNLAVASSGEVALDYPPTRAIMAGKYGERPLEGTRWVTAAGGRDREQEHAGIEAMRRTASWLTEQGAIVVASIEDLEGGHGALMRSPANARRVLDIFLVK